MISLLPTICFAVIPDAQLTDTRWIKPMKPTPSFPGRTIRVLFFVLLLLMCVTGARCRRTPRPVHVFAPAPAAAAPAPVLPSAVLPGPNTGSSGGVNLIIGSGYNGWVGAYPYGTFGTKIITDDINTYRVSLGLTSLVWHDGLAAVAHLHATDMATADTPFIVNGLGIDPYERLVSSTPPVSFTNAQVVVHQGLVGAPKNVLNQLLADPAAKAVVEDPTWTQIGVGWDKLAGNTYQSIIFGQGVLP